MFARVYNLFFVLFVALPLLAAASAIPEVRAPPEEVAAASTIPDVRASPKEVAAASTVSDARTSSEKVTASQCNVGSIVCCNSVQEASVVSLGSLHGILETFVGPVTGLVGITCSPTTVIGTGGNSCNAQPVCCSNNTFNGIIAIGCSPVNINL